MNGNVALAAFAGAGVEFLEIAAIAYALGVSGYWREAILGSVSGMVLVFTPAVFAWPLFRMIPIFIFELAVGGMLLGLGISWVMKSVRRRREHRRAGWIQDPLRGYEGHIEPSPVRFSYLNAAIMTKGAAVEGFEVCLIVTGLALASGAWMSAVAGAVLALATTLGMVVLLHGKLRKVPEVALKFWAGLVLTGIGALWVYEGLSRLVHRGAG